MQHDGREKFGLGPGNPHGVTRCGAKPWKETECQLAKDKPLNQPEQRKNQHHDESGEQNPTAGRDGGLGIPMHHGRVGNKPAPEVTPLKSCSPPHRMVRRATVPPRTIFTKDVSKVTRDPTDAREKDGKI
jgi:hypothetical protein